MSAQFPYHHLSGPPPMRRPAARFPIVAIVLALMVVAVSVGIGLYFGLKSITDKPSGEFAPKVTELVLPDRLGPLLKSADQERVQEAMASAGALPGGGRKYAAIYHYAENPGRIVIFTGATSELAADQDALEGFYHGLDVGYGPASNRTKIQVPLDGLAECGDFPRAPDSVATCAWSGNGGLVGLIDFGASIPECAELLRNVLPEIVRQAPTTVGSS